MPNQVVNWIEKNPWMAGGLIVGGGLVILWYMGFFTKAQSSSDGGQTNMAAAYYAAEAAQGVAGTQLAMQQSSDTAATAQVGLQAQAATSIAQIQGQTQQSLAGYGADVAKTQGWFDLVGQQYADQTVQSLAGYSADTAKTLAGYSADTAKTLATLDSWTTTHNTDVTAAGAVAHDQYAYLTTQDNNKASIFTNFMNNILPAELQRSGGNLAGTLPLGVGLFDIGLGTTTPSPAAMRAAGFTEQQIADTWSGLRK